jgi:putative membrane protein
VGLITAAVLAIGFLVFIVQNYEKVSIEFLGFEGRLSLAIALLLSAIIGALVVAVPGAVRIGQLRRALRKNAKH